MYNSQPSFGDNSQLIQPGMMGYGGFNLPSTQYNNREGAMGYPNQMAMGMGIGQQSSYPFPTMGSVPSMNMGRMGMSRTYNTNNSH